MSVGNEKFEQMLWSKSEAEIREMIVTAGGAVSVAQEDVLGFEKGEGAMILVK